MVVVNDIHSSFLHFSQALAGLGPEPHLFYKACHQQYDQRNYDG